MIHIYDIYSIYHMDLRMLLHHVFLARRDASANAPQGSQGCIERVRIPQGCHNGASVWAGVGVSQNSWNWPSLEENISIYLGDVAFPSPFWMP